MTTPITPQGLPVQPSYYVQHPDDSYSLADPQPSAQAASAAPVARFNWGKGGFEWLVPYEFDLHNMRPLYLCQQPTQASSVKPVASVLYLSDTGLCSEISEELPWGMDLYASAPPSPASVPSNFNNFEVLQITTAYEQGFGHALRTELNNPYPEGQQTHTAWEHGRKEGQRKQPVQASKCAMPEACPDHCHEAYPVQAVDAVDERAAFEADVWTTYCERVERDGDGYKGYCDSLRFKFWKQARAALQASRQPQAQQAVAEGAVDVSKAVALYEAVSAIYFDDSSDFKPALLSAIRALSPEMEEMLRDDPRSAWQKADEAKDAALATKEPK